MRGLARDCVMYMRSMHGPSWGTLPQKRDGVLTELGRDQEAVLDMLWHAMHTSWFDYHTGSRLVLLRFLTHFRAMARDGVPVWFERPGPTTREAQPTISSTEIRAKAKKKFAKVLRRRYLVTIGIAIKSLIKYFAVLKGKDDVRMVYHAMANKLNNCVWVPTFWLPTIDSLARAVNKQMWITDCDVEDMFLNYQLHRSVMPFTRVDLASLYESDDKVGPRWALWDRNLMGFAASPYNSVKMALVAKEVCQGDHKEQGIGLDGNKLNLFQWERIELNLPGLETYGPCKSWISKVRSDRRVACNIFTYVDDECVTGPDEELTW
jgi:hypothetical protein